MKSKATDVFHKAVLNEVYVDTEAFFETKLDAITRYKIFRPYKLADKVRKRPFAYVTIFRFINFLWPFINLLLQSSNLVKAIVANLKVNKADKLNRRIVVVATPRLLDQLEKVPNQEDIPNQYLFIGACKNIKHKKNVNFYSYLCLGDIFWAFTKSVVLPFTTALKTNQKIQLMVSFDWFLSFRIFETNKQIKEIWFGNHFDRWAVLVESLEAKVKILVQHGIENGLWSPPSKLSTISKAYLIDENQKQHFINKIIANDFTSEILISSLKLTAEFDESKYRVLIVGNSGVHISDETQLIKNLQSKRIELILKPHPVLSKQPYYELKKEFNYNLIEKKTLFPIVDLVISYDSTLAVEYEQKSVDVIYYSQYSIAEIIPLVFLRSEGL